MVIERAGLGQMRASAFPSLRPPSLLLYLAFQGQCVPSGVVTPSTVLFQDAQEFNVGQRLTVVADTGESGGKRVRAVSKASTKKERKARAEAHTGPPTALVLPRGIRARGQGAG